jgi:hypothetical protein
MKKLLMVLLFLTGSANAQEFIKESKSITGIFEIKDKPKAEIFALINKWISINYNSSVDVIQMNDLQSGTIIIKGINEVQQKNNTKILYPKMKNIPESTPVKYNHLIEVNIKDNKYRIIYKLTSIASQDYGFNDISFGYVNLQEIDTKAIDDFNEVMDENLKKGMIGEKKRELMKIANKESIVELNSNLEKNIKNTMLSIEKSVSAVSKDGW